MKQIILILLLTMPNVSATASMSDMMFWDYMFSTQPTQVVQPNLRTEVAQTHSACILFLTEHFAQHNQPININLGSFCLCVAECIGIGDFEALLNPCFGYCIAKLERNIKTEL